MGIATLNPSTPSRKADLADFPPIKPEGNPSLVSSLPFRSRFPQMKNLPCHLALLAATAWVGGLWAVGYLAVPILFHTQPDRQLAGMLAGQMFSVLGYLGIVCGAYLMAWRFAASGRAALREPLIRIVAAMLLLTLLSQFGIQPLMAELKAQALPLEVSQSPYAGQFRMWHGVSSIGYLLQSLLGALLVLRISGK